MRGVRARRFDADGHDQDLDPASDQLAVAGPRRLTWVDIDLHAGGSLDVVADALSLDERDRERVGSDGRRARLVQATGRLHITIEALEPDPDAPDEPPVRRELDLLAAPGIVVTVHRGSIDAIERFHATVSEETAYGALDPAGLLSAIADEVINDYHAAIERVERRIDELDQRALAGRGDLDILTELVAIRRRISDIRRLLAPHRIAFAALARPENAEDDGIGRPWPGLVDRLDVAITAVEALREALLGTYDIHMGRVAQRANDVMKALTILSAVLLPAVVLAGIMGMNFKHPFFDDANNLYVVLAVMAGFSASLLAAARWRGWI